MCVCACVCVCARTCWCVFIYMFVGLCVCVLCLHIRLSGFRKWQRLSDLQLKMFGRPGTGRALNLSGVFGVCGSFTG